MGTAPEGESLLAVEDPELGMFVHTVQPSDPSLLLLLGLGKHPVWTPKLVPDSRAQESPGPCRSPPGLWRPCCSGACAAGPAELSHHSGLLD